MAAWGGGAEPPLIPAEKGRLAGLFALQSPGALVIGPETRGKPDTGNGPVRGHAITKRKLV